MSPKTWIPWQAKIAAKIALSRLPVPYRFWRAVSCFDLGPMEDPEYALRVFREHFSRARPERGGDRFGCLELGPGNTLFTALIAPAFGFTEAILVDTGAFAADALPPYRNMAARLAADALPTPLLEGCRTLADVLRAAGARYLTGGLASLRELPPRSVHFAFSHAVLEHVRRAEFEPTMRELARILHRDGVASHRVDLTDHLSGRLDNLRFAERRWESDLFAKSGFYTNRLRLPEILAACESAGLSVEVSGIERWGAPPTPRAKLAASFRDLPDSDLTVSAFDLLMRPRPR